jgi:hypothetical protein
VTIHTNSQPSPLADSHPEGLCPRLGPVDGTEPRLDRSSRTGHHGRREPCNAALPITSGASQLDPDLIRGDGPSPVSPILTAEINVHEALDPSLAQRGAKRAIGAVSKPRLPAQKLEAGQRERPTADDIREQTRERVRCWRCWAAGSG